VTRPFDDDAGSAIISLIEAQADASERLSTLDMGSMITELPMQQSLVKLNRYDVSFLS
jgi:hypothetical protein